MQKPPMPADEDARLRSLRALGVLDSPPEERFDRITRLAMLAVDVPIALVSLVDANRQWFKSCQGLDATQTGRDVSFCGHAILSDEPLIVEDAFQDERFADNPLVTGEPRVRFYAGFPLSDGEGHKLGTLCVIDHEPRQLTPQLRQLLSELASMAETELTSIAREEALLRLDAIHRRLEATTEAIDEGLITADWTGHIVAVNRAAELIFGSPREELLGEHLSHLMPDEWRSQLTATSAEAIVDAIGPGVELTAHRRDGTTFSMEVTTAVTRDGADRLAIAVVRDITLRKQIAESLRHSEQLHRSVFAAMHEAVMVVDAEGSVLTANESARRVTESLYATDATVRDREIDVIGLDGTVIPLGERPVPFTLATGEAVSGRVIGFPLESGEIRWLEIDTQPLIRPGESLPYAVVLSMDDITDRLALDQLKSQFVSIVSHELRTPLTAIRGSLSLLNSGALGELPPKASQMMEMAHSNTERLVRLVNDILDLQRMESGAEELQLATCTDGGLLDEVSALMRPLADEAGVTLTIEPAGASLVADRDRLIQTLSNLVSNAIKFSDPGGRVALATQRGEGCLRFTVVDEGRGIPSDKLDSIFGRFQQVEASDARAKGGTGLGLAICRQIVELHGGAIHVESELGSGSTFVFTIPVASSEPSATDEMSRADDMTFQDVTAS